MDVYNTNAVTVAVVIGSVGYSWIKHWLRKRDLVKDYIQVASDIQKHAEKDVVLELEDVTEDVDIEVRAEKPRKRVRHHGLFKSYLVQVGKAKFGCPSRTKANELVVRKFLYDKSVEHGVIARHIAQNLDIAVQLVFVPSKSELLALAVKHTPLSKIRDEVSDKLGGPPHIN